MDFCFSLRRYFLGKTCLAAFLLSSFAPVSIPAATLIWDGDTTTSGQQDGTGNWNLTDLRWYNGTDNQAWVNGATPDSATFGNNNGAAGTVIITENITVDDITFNASTTGNYTIAGSSAAVALTLSGTPVITANVAATITAKLSGTEGMTKAGTGNLTLSGGFANDFTGLTTVNAGTLTLQKTAGVNAIAGDVLVKGTDASNTGSLVWGTNANQIADSSSITLEAFGIINFSGRAETFTNFTKTGGDTLNQGGNLTFTGTLAVSGGTSNNGNDFGYTINSGGKTTAGTVDFRNFSGKALQMGGANTSVVTALEVGVGGLLLNGQNLQLNTASTDQKGNKITLKGNVTASGTNNFTMNTGSLGASAVHQIDLDGGIRTFDITGTTHINESAGGNAKLITIVNGGITKTGDGILQLNGTESNTYTGLTTVTAGTLNLNKTSGKDAVAANVLVNGGNLAWLQTNQLKDSSNIELTSGTVDFKAKDETLGNLTMSGGTLSFGTGSTITMENLTKTGGSLTSTNFGTLIVNGVLKVSGGTSNGTAQIGWTLNSGSTAVSLNRVNTFDVRDYTEGSRLAFLMGGNNTVNIATLEIGSGGLLLNGQTLTLNHGTVTDGKGGQIILKGDVTAAGTNNFTVGNLGSEVSTSVTRIDLSTGTRNWNITGGTTAINSGMGIIGSAEFKKSGAGTLRVDVASQHTGKTTISGGTFQLGSAGRIDSSPWIEIESGGTFNTSSVSGGYAYAAAGNGVISGEGTIQGSLTIGAGKVLKPGSSTNAANVLTAGANAGTMTITSSLIFAPATKSTIAEFNILNATTSDKIVIGSNLTLNANSDFVVTFDSSFTNQAAGQSWTLVDWTGALTTNGFSTGTNLRTGLDSDGNEGNLFLPTLNTGLFWEISNFSGNGALTISIVGAVPEPSRAILIGAGLALTFLRRRRSH